MTVFGNSIELLLTTKVSSSQRRTGLAAFP
jgi:hypothetical protein